MTDIEEELRSVQQFWRNTKVGAVCTEAAAEIERLHTMLSEVGKDARKMANFSEFSNDVIRYAFQRGRVAAASAIVKKLEMVGTKIEPPSVSEARATGRRDGMEEAAQIVEVMLADAMTGDLISSVAAAIRAAMEK